MDFSWRQPDSTPLLSIPTDINFIEVAITLPPQFLWRVHLGIHASFAFGERLWSRQSKFSNNYSRNSVNQRSDGQRHIFPDNVGGRKWKGRNGWKIKEHQHGLYCCIAVETGGRAVTSIVWTRPCLGTGVMYSRTGDSATALSAGGCSSPTTLF